MRRLIRLTSLIGLSVVTTSAFAGVKYVAADDSLETQLCVSAAMATPIQFYTAVRDSGYSLRSVSNGVTCNSANIGEFAQSAGNDRNARTLLRVYNGEGHVEVRDEVSQISSAGLDIASADRIVYIRGGK